MLNLQTPNDMEIKNLGDGLVELTPSVQGNKIEYTPTGAKYSNVVCKERIVGDFEEIEVSSPAETAEE